MASSASGDGRSDESLLAAIRGGDEAAFEAIYRRHRDWVVRLAQRLTGDRDEALDVLQETFAYLVRRAPGLRLSGRLTTFLYPVVRHLSRDARRQRARFRSDEEVLAAARARVLPVERTARAELAAVMRALPAGRREVLLMRFVDGMALAEIGEALGIPVGTVKSRLHLALEALRHDGRTRRYFSVRPARFCGEAGGDAGLQMAARRSGG